MKKILKIIGLVILLLSMAYASNWDLPKETQADWEREHAEEIEAYLEARSEEWEVYGGALPSELFSESEGNL